MSISKEAIKKAEQCLVDNGVEYGEAGIVLQALGYILLDKELYSKQDIRPPYEVTIRFVGEETYYIPAKNKQEAEEKALAIAKKCDIETLEYVDWKCEVLKTDA